MAEARNLRDQFSFAEFEPVAHYGFNWRHIHPTELDFGWLDFVCGARNRASLQLELFDYVWGFGGLRRRNRAAKPN